MAAARAMRVGTTENSGVSMKSRKRRGGCGGSEGQRRNRWATRRRWRGGERGDSRRGARLENLAWRAPDVRHDLRFRGQRSERGTQRTVQLVTGRGCAVRISMDQQLHARAARADQLHALCLDQGRGHRHPNGQRKPGQHQAGEERGVAQSLHGRDYPRPRQNFGPRRSRSEARPSFTSGPAKPMNSSASEVSKAGPACRSQLFSEYLVQRIAVCEPSASLSATS